MSFIGLAANIRLESLSADNSAEIAKLLNETWPQLYGNTGCLVFSEEYLTWLYGGPDRQRHIIQGHRVNGELVAVQAALFRRLSDGEREWRAHIATHLAISPKLDLGTRVTLAAKISEALAADLGDGNIAISYFEKGKGLVRSTKRIAEDRSSQRVRQVPFRQAIVNPRKVRTLAKSAIGLSVRTADKSDIPAIQSLLCTTKSALYLDPSPDALWHHFSNAPGALCLVAEEGSKVVGFLSTYVLDWNKDGQITRNIAAEVILGDRPEHLAALLDRALEQVESVDARGIVLDNASYLDEQVAYEAGILPIPKEMVFVTRCTNELPPLDQGFLIDVK